MTRPEALRRLAALVLLLATVVFVLGTRAERSLAGETAEVRSPERAAVTEAVESAEEGSTGHKEGEAAEASTNAAAVAGVAETEGEDEEGHTDEAAVPHDEANEASETILGINPESTGAIAAAVAVSLVLAAAVWFWGTPIVLLATAAFALLFAALDLRELAHQLSEARSGLATIALLAAVLHVGVAVLVGLAVARRNASGGTPALV
jgi:hypothetical protein